jgi:hypothetical protein
MTKVTTIPGPVIEADEGESSAIDLTNAELVSITMPEEWTAALMSFMVSADGTTFHPLMQPDGEEVVINVVPGSTVMIPTDWARCVGFLKLVSGLPDDLEPQEERRQFSVGVIKGGPSVYVDMTGTKPPPKPTPIEDTFER